MNVFRASVSKMSSLCKGRDAVILIGTRTLHFFMPTVHGSIELNDALKCLENACLLVAKAEANNFGKQLADKNLQPSPAVEYIPWPHEDEFDEEIGCTPKFFHGLGCNPQYGRTDKFLTGLEQFAGLLRFLIADGTDKASIAMPKPAKPPNGYLLSLKNLIKRHRWNVDNKLMRAMLAAVAGELQCLFWSKDFDARDRKMLVRVDSAWKPRIPGVPTLVLDPTIQAERLGPTLLMVVKEVQEVKPPIDAHRQVPHRATAKMQPSAAAKILRYYLMTRPRDRIGFISNLKYEEVSGDLTEAEKARLMPMGFFEDPETLHGCGFVLVLGLSPVPPEAIRERLAQEGKPEAATKDGDWGPDPWIATLPSGKQIEVDRIGYRDPDWRSVGQSLSRGRLYALLEKLRCSSVVFSAEDLGLNLSEPPQPFDLAHMRVMEAVQPGWAKNATRIKRSSESFSEENSESFLVANLAYPLSPISSKNLAQITGIPGRSVRRILSELETASLVRRVSTKGGWLSV